MTLGMTTNTDQLNTMTTRTSPDQTGINVLPPDAIDTHQSTANEYLSYQVDKNTRIGKRIFGT